MTAKCDECGRVRAVKAVVQSILRMRLRLPAPMLCRDCRAA